MTDYFMKKTLLTISILTLASCSTYSLKEDRMNRFNPKAIRPNQVPNVKVSEFQFKPASRSIASVPSFKEQAEDHIENGPSNKKLYFLTLLDQYETMKKFTEEFTAPEVNICPHFHTSILDRKTAKKSGSDFKSKLALKYDRTKLDSAEYLTKHPELSLPLVNDGTAPMVVDALRKYGPLEQNSRVKEVVNEALKIHLAKTYTELQQLCEFGSSDNYYIYENLISHIKSNNFKAKTENLNTLLKTTLFSNMAIEASLEKKYQKTQTPMMAQAVYANEVISRLNVNWAQEYFDYIKN